MDYDKSLDEGDASAANIILKKKKKAPKKKKVAKKKKKPKVNNFKQIIQFIKFFHKINAKFEKEKEERLLIFPIFAASLICLKFELFLDFKSNIEGKLKTSTNC